MNVIKQNVNGYDINPNKVGFRSDTVMGPFPGMIMQTQEEYPTNPQTEEAAALPDLYYMPEHYKKPKTFLDKLKKVDLMGLIHPWFEHPLLMLGTALGISMSVDAFDKSCNKEYEKSIVGKAANFGDKIEQSAFVQKDGTQKFFGSIKKGWKNFKARLKKNDVIRAMVETPSEPEYAMPKQEIKNTNYRIIEKFKELAQKIGFVPNADTISGEVDLNLRLKDLILDSKEEEYIKNTYSVSKLSKAPREEAVNRIILQRIGKSEAEISSIVNKSNATGTVLKELLTKSGLTDIELEKIFKDEVGTEEVVKLVDKACANLQNLRVANGRLVFPGKIQPLANIESPRGIHNRIHSVTVGAGAKTETGRFMSKFVQKLHEMFTFRGAKLGVLFWVTPFLVGTILNTIKADKKEKAGTAATGLVNTFAWVLYFPLATKLLYALGGMQYAGMGKEKVQKLKNYIKEFNEKTKLDNPKRFQSIEEYRAAKKVLKDQLKDLRKVKNQNFLTKILRGISKFTKSDLLKIESFQGGSKVGNFLRRIPNKMKDLFLGRGRAVVFIIALIPLVDKIIDKITTTLFGKGYDEFKEQEILDAKEKQEEYTMDNLRSRLIEIQNNKMNPPAEAAETTEALNNVPAKTIIPKSVVKMAELAEEDTENVLGQSNPVENELAEIEDNAVNSNEPILAEDNTETALPEEPVAEDNTETALPEEPVAEDNTETVLPQEPVAEAIQSEELPQESAAVAQAVPEETLNAQETPQAVSEDVNSSSIEEPSEDEQANIFAQNKTNNPENKKVTEPVKRDNYTYIPSSENILAKDNPAQNIHKYIPAQTPAKFDKMFDNSGLEAAMRRADRAEKRALDVLAGNFEHL